MNSDLLKELQQQRPFASIRHEAQLSIIRTGSRLMDAFDQMLRPYGITVTQYNVLRILRGAEPEGLCRNEIRDRMVNRMPDVTRLLDRMESAGLISRSRSTEDRRMVRTQITSAGRKMLDDVSDDVEEEIRRPFVDLSDDELASMIRMLSVVRGRI